MSANHRYRLGCDIGGTFTDFVLHDIEAGSFQVHKVLTTPADPSEAVETGITAMNGGGFLAETEYVIHGTTLVINAVIERKGADTAIIATEGFRDSLEMRREIRYDIYDVTAVYPEPLVARPRRVDVPERLYASGKVRTQLNEDAVRERLRELADDGVESIAVVLLHAYANPDHERRIAEIAADVAPDIAISLSSDVLPEIKEYERTATTSVNAYVKPLVERYIAKLEKRLAAQGLERGLYMMLSSGGIISPATAKAHPVRLVESGPVGGALAATKLGSEAGFDSVLMFDMGGTTAKSCLITDGQIPIAGTYEVDRVHRFKRGSGTPLGVPSVDIIEIGAGGGSIAAINDMGLLSVGPKSAGADPGPICYGRGGKIPTVTDADLVLGYLDAEFFLGGGMTLDKAGAETGIANQIAKPLDLSVREAAWGIHEVVNENMASAMRMYVTEKGGDLSIAAVVAIGGAGPGHATDFARRLGAKTLLIPRGAGVYSALGFLVAPVSFEHARTHITNLQTASADAIQQNFAELQAETADVIRDAAPDAELSFTLAADIRYTGQGAALRIPITDDFEPAVLTRAFLDAYAERYGNAYDDMPVQIVTYRATATAATEIPALALPFSGEDINGALKGVREAYCPLGHQMISHHVYAMDKLPTQGNLAGPVIIEEESSTLVVGAGGEVIIDRRGWLVVTLADEEPSS